MCLCDYNHYVKTEVDATPETLYVLNICLTVDAQCNSGIIITKEPLV